MFWWPSRFLFWLSWLIAPGFWISGADCTVERAKKEAKEIRTGEAHSATGVAQEKGTQKDPKSGVLWRKTKQ